jgi:hypothetical protein
MAFSRLTSPGGVEADGAVQGFARDVDLIAAFLLGDHRQANAAMGNRIPQRDIGKLEAGRLDGEAQALFQRLDMGDFSYGGDDAGEHGASLSELDGGDAITATRSRRWRDGELLLKAGRNP